MKVNTKLLQQKIKDSGLKMGFIAEKLGRSRQALSDKIQGKTEFLPSEIRILCELLHLSDDDRRLIFLI
jgi:cyanate lyase|nr:MAG TPA: regulatory protein [Caudoviricetes sp.]